MQFKVSVAAVVSICLLGATSAAQQPVRKDARSYKILCKVTRAAFETDDNGRSNLNSNTRTLPDITTVENAKAEYLSERKVQNGIYQFRLQVLVQKISEGKVRLEMLIEDVWPEGSLEKPLIHKHSLQTTQQTALGAKLKIALEEKSDKGEGAWVELTVREVTDDE